MKKQKLISALLAISAITASVCSVFAAEEKKVTVTVNDRLIYFADQDPVISENGDTLIPVRGVFEAMDAKVSWNAKERSVYVQAKDNISRLKLYIDNPIAKKLTLTGITTMDSEDIELSTPPTLMNDRTMIPLRVVGENIGAIVDWDADTRHITITSKEYTAFVENNKTGEEESTANDALKSSLPYLYIEADKTQAEVGETVTVSLKIANTQKLPENSAYAGITATLFYDKSKLSSSACKLIVNGKEASQILSASNPDFYDNSLKYVSILMPDSDLSTQDIEDGTVSQFTFTVVDKTSTEISLSNRITDLGEDTAYMIDAGKSYNYLNLSKPTDIFIDTTPIVINAQ